MERRSSVHHHFIQAIKGGLVTKILNVTRGRPTLSFKEVTEIYNGYTFNHNGAKAERSCISALEEKMVKSEPNSSVCNPNDDGQGIDTDDNGFDNFTLKQIKKSCKKRKRKNSQGPCSSKSNIKVEASSSLEDFRESQMSADDFDFRETLGSWRSKLSKKAKKRKCIKDPISTYTQEIIPVVKSKEVQNGSEIPPSTEVSATPVEVKLEVPETDCLDGLDEYSCIVAREGTEILNERYLDSDSKEDAYLIPLRIEWPSSWDNAMSVLELNSDQSPNFPAIEFESEEGIIHPDHNYIPPLAISVVEHHNSDIYDSQSDGDTDTPVTLPNLTTHEGFRDDNPLLGDYSNEQFAAGAEVQAKPSFTIEGGLSSDDSPEYEKQSFASVLMRHVNEATDELSSGDEHRGSSKEQPPARLLSNRKAISPISQEKLCKAAESVDLNLKNNLKSRGKLYRVEQTDKKNGASERLNHILKPGFTDNPNKVSITPKTLKSGSHPKGISKSPHSSRPANRLGCNSVQSCSKSAIAFSKQQMHDVESLTMKLTKELKSMKDIVDDMLRSEFCLNTSLRYRVNEARMAVKNATRAEEDAKRCLSFMARDCSRFCKIMKLADGPAAPPPPAPQNIARKERKKIAFADEAGGRLCQIRLYEDDGVFLSESN